MNSVYDNKEKAKDLLLDKTCSNCKNALKTQNNDLYCDFEIKVRNKDPNSIPFNEIEPDREEEASKILKKVCRDHTCLFFIPWPKSGKF